MRRQWHSLTVPRHHRDQPTVSTYRGAADVHALILGRAQSGLQALLIV
jgi:hypothetical protein